MAKKRKGEKGTRERKIIATGPCDRAREGEKGEYRAFGGKRLVQKVTGGGGEDRDEEE